MAGERVLIIDDDPEHVEFLLANVISPQGYLAQVAVSGQAGIRAAQEERPDLVLLDLTLGDINYTEILRELQRYGDPPVILLTPAGAEAEALLGIRLGARDAQMQPSCAEEMSRSIARLLYEERMTREYDCLVRKAAAANEALERSLAEAQTLHEATRSMISCLNPSAVAKAVVQGAASMLRADESYLLLYAPDDDALYLRAAANQDETGAATSYVLVEDNIARHVVHTGEPVALSSEEGALISLGFGQALGRNGLRVRSLINVPLMRRERIDGVLGVANVASAKTFTERDVVMLSSLADYAATALNCAETYAQVDKKLSAVLAEFSALQHGTDLITRNVSDGVYTVDKDLRIVSANPALERITGWKESELLGRHYDQILVPQADDGELLPDQTAPGKALNTKSSIAPTRYTILRKDGQRVEVTGVAAFLKAADTSDSVVVGIVRETEPEARGNNGFGHKVFPWLPSQNLQLDQLFEETLNSLPLAAGSAPDHCHPVTLRPIINQVAKSFQGVGCNHSFEITLAPDLPFAVGNESKIELALVHLIDNALLLCEPEHTILISANADDDHVIISVEVTRRWTGAEGGAEQLQSSRAAIDRGLFSQARPFWWVAPQLKLFMAKKLIQAQGGRFWAEERASAGIRFNFSLPRIEVKDVVQAFAD